MTNNENIKVLELFSGIKASSRALLNLKFNVEDESIDYDKRVIEVQNKLWDTDIIPRDVRDYKGEFKKFDLVVAGFPCQPFSNAGKSQGFDDEKGRGDLFVETLRIIKEVMPDNVILENVKGILQQKHKWIIKEIENQLIEMGYKIHTQLINAKHYIPQNRERVFIMASLKKQPQEIILPEERVIKGAVLKNYLDHYLGYKVDDKLYYSYEKLLKIYAWKSQEKPVKKIAHNETETIKTITTRTQSGTASQQMIVEKLQSENNYIDIEELLKEKNNIKGLFSTFNQENIIIGEGHEQVGTITATGANHRQKILTKFLNEIRIRSLTPRESYRLMGWEDKYINKIIDLPKSKVHLTAGNSMVIPVMEAVLKSLLEEVK